MFCFLANFFNLFCTQFDWSPVFHEFYPIDFTLNFRILSLPEKVSVMSHDQVMTYEIIRMDAHTVYTM